jgi:hypothetical protein
MVPFPYLFTVLCSVQIHINAAYGPYVSTLVTVRVKSNVLDAGSPDVRHLGRGEVCPLLLELSGPPHSRLHLPSQGTLPGGRS